MDALDLTRAADEAGDRPLLIAEDRVLSFAEVRRRSAVADELQAPIAGAPVPFVPTPTIDGLVMLLGAMDRRTPLALLHARWTASERARALDLVSRPVPEDDPLHVARCTLHVPHSSSPPDPPLCVLFTSGTTATPKGVVLDRGAFIASAQAHAANIPFAPNDRWLLAMPLAHAGGLSIVTRAIVSRTCVVVRPAFDPSDVLAAISRDGVTLLSVVPAMLSRLLEADKEAILARLSAILVGGAHFPSELRARAIERGVKALATYGLTETCSQVVTQSVEDAMRSAPGSGRPLAGVELEVRRADGSIARADEVGRIHVRGPMCMRGYVGGPERARDAWLDTGDDGSIDAAGFVQVLGRADDTIVTGGENVHPVEVEDALRACPGVRAVAVFGCPDPRWGAVVAAALVLDRGVDPRSVLELSSASLAPFKRPRRYAVVDELPVTPSGKIARRELHRTLAPLTLENTR